MKQLDVTKLGTTASDQARMFTCATVAHALIQMISVQPPAKGNDTHLVIERVLKLPQH
jgi:hypothetical protein